MMQANLKLSTIGQIALSIQDLEKMVAFYKDVLGLPFIFQAPPGLAFFDCAGTRLMLDASPEAPKQTNSILYFKVDDIQVATDTLRERGASIEQEPHLVAKLPDHDLWMSFIKDPEGNFLGLMSEVRQPVYTQ